MRWRQCVHVSYSHASISPPAPAARPSARTCQERETERERASGQRVVSPLPNRRWPFWGGAVTPRLAAHRAAQHSATQHNIAAQRTWSKIGKRILSKTLAQKLSLKLSPWNLSVSNSTCGARAEHNERCVKHNTNTTTPPHSPARCPSRLRRQKRPRRPRERGGGGRNVGPKEAGRAPAAGPLYFSAPRGRCAARPAACRR